MQLFFNPSISNETQTVTFDKEESRHIIKVLRKSEGDTIYITNGKGLVITSEIIAANDKRCTVQITSVKEIEKNRNYYLHVGIAPTKLNDRFEWFLEKATEIGIDEITPLICDHSERKVIKHDRYEKIIHAAAKQSLNYHFPVLNPLMSLKNFINQLNSFDLKLIAHCEESSKNEIKKVLKPKSNILILIGPEGDFSSEEILVCLKNNFIPVSLGKNRLRTETAGIAAVHSVAFIND